MTDYPKMNPELKPRWIAWLRDPANHQGLQALKEKTSEGVTEFCCLGGLCTVAGLSSRVVDVISEHGTLSYSFVDIGKKAGSPFSNEYTAFLPTQFAEYAGIPGNIQTILSEMNDGTVPDNPNEESKRYTFAEIADWIEENL